MIGMYLSPSIHESTPAKEATDATQQVARIAWDLVLGITDRADTKISSTSLQITSPLSHDS
jgi:hypothetical protein